MQINLRQRIFIALTIIWMITIFCFSAEPGDESSELSGGLSYRLVSIVDDVFGMHWDESEKSEMVEAMSFPIRKAAHMSEYALLGILAFASTVSGKEKARSIASHKTYIWALGLVFVYACTDEFHQLFVPGRSGMFTDVLIDTAGGLIGLICILIVSKIRAKRSKNGIVNPDKTTDECE